MDIQIPKNFMTSLIEDHIRGYPELVEKYTTGLTVVDFKPGDIVKCTYDRANTLFQVSGESKEHDKERIVLRKLGDSEDWMAVDPDFLIKENVNKSAVSVLYGKKV